MDTKQEAICMSVKKRRVLVTGSSSGIGRAITLHLLDQGHTVWGISRSSQQDIDHPRFNSFPFDLTRLKTAHAKDFSPFEPVDALICNAGQGLFGHLETCSIAAIQKTFEINTLSTIYLVKHLLPTLKQKDLADIIFIGSRAALAGKKEGSIYCASKFALRGFAQSLRLECASSSVRVATIQPGMVRTPFFNQLSFEPQEGKMHALDPREIARTVELILASPPEAVFDEIVLSPHKHAVKKKPNSQADGDE